MNAIITVWLLLFSQGHAEPLKGNKYLRAVALDILGRPPTPEEYEQMGSGSELPIPLICSRWFIEYTKV